MKIVLVSPAYPYRGGIAHFADSLAHHFNLQGDSASIVNFRRLYPKLLFPGQSQWEPKVTDASERPGGYLSSVSPLSWVTTARRIMNDRPEVVIIQYWEPFLAPALGTLARLLRRRKVKVACIVHNALAHERRPGGMLLGRYCLNGGNRVICLSRHVQDDLLERLRVSVPITCLFHPVYEGFGARVEKRKARNVIGVDPTARVILFFGMVRRYKGLAVLLEAVGRVQRDFPNVMLLVAGEIYEERRYYEKLIERYSLEKRVRLVDRYIPRTEVPYYFCAADLVALPYLGGTQSGVLSMVYHFERPFVVSEVGGVSEMTPAGLDCTVPMGNVEALADWIDRFFREGPEEVHQAAIRRTKENLGWDRFCKRLKQEIGD